MARRGVLLLGVLLLSMSSLGAAPAMGAHGTGIDAVDCQVIACAIAFISHGEEKIQGHGGHASFLGLSDGIGILWGYDMCEFDASDSGGSHCQTNTPHTKGCLAIEAITATTTIPDSDKDTAADCPGVGSMIGEQIDKIGIPDDP